jgi:hypothetical protein
VTCSEQEGGKDGEESLDPHEGLKPKDMMAAGCTQSSQRMTLGILRIITAILRSAWLIRLQGDKGQRGGQTQGGWTGGGGGTRMWIVLGNTDEGEREDIDEDRGRERTDEDEDMCWEGKRAKLKDREEMRMRTDEDEDIRGWGQTRMRTDGDEDRRCWGQMKMRTDGDEDRWRWGQTGMRTDEDEDK